eukprot:TRINITY_DN34266_c0_g1_i1.p1 TRINITY_DN34266_c0_g1~~TRINITY_DN34266_c0_g1_i1.p1  ORF type:complete len:108 (-),score=26.13 TRINITY_DN34266_c0_g1_i1:87-410(-)
MYVLWYVFFFFQAEDGIRDAQESRGLGDVYKRQDDGEGVVVVVPRPLDADIPPLMILLRTSPPRWLSVGEDDDSIIGLAGWRCGGRGWMVVEAVSYTHLTLPTKRIV